MALPLMPKATAVWLVENTALTFDQIGDFCGLHKLEVQAIADGEVATGIIGLNPVLNGQLGAIEIKRCEADPRARLKMLKSDLPQPTSRTKGPRYTPVSKRADKPDAVAYLIKMHPELQDAQIARLLGTTKDTIQKVRDRTHWNSVNIKPRNPVLLGLCKQMDLDAALKKAQRRVAREQKAAGIDPSQIQQPEPQPFPDELPPEEEPRQSRKDEPLDPNSIFSKPFPEPSSESDDQPEISPEDMDRGMA